MGDAAITGAAGASIISLALLLRPATRRWSVHVAVAAAGLALTATLILTRALWRVDPALAYVSRHASRDTPGPYRIAGLWGGMEGSLLVWSAMIATITGIAAVRLRRRDHETCRHEIAVLAAGGTASAAFLAISRWRASPFVQLDVPTGRGDGLLAILQHPAMIYHPPILYAGLTLTVVPFGITIGALLGRRLDEAWRHTVTPWLRASWLVLGIGIVTGSQWAYAELGWGGFWAWDPVENSSLLPWLAVTAALHTISAPRTRLALTTAAATVGSFCLVMVGAYITRSGTTGSIHAFAESTRVGRPLLWLAALTTAIGIAAVLRFGLGSMVSPDRSRVTALATHSVFAATAVAAIAVGTVWPIVDGWRSGEVRTIVRPDYYHRILAPVIGLALVAMSVEPLITRQRSVSARRTGMSAGAGAVLALLATVGIGSSSWTATVVAVCAAVAVGVAIASTVRPGGSWPSRRRVGIALAHGGFALMLFGAITASAGDDHRFFVREGEATTLDGWTVELERMTTGATERYEFVRAELAVDVGNGSTRFAPELRAYEAQRQPTAEASIDGDPSGDVIVVLESIGEQADRAVVVVRTRPLMPWVWLGAATTLLGGVVTIERRRRASQTAPDAAPDPAGTAAQRSG